jgi:hypothetical protein
MVKRAAGSISRVVITTPRDVREFLEERAIYHGGTLSAEAVRSIRERMERERGVNAGRIARGLGPELWLHDGAIQEAGETSPLIRPRAKPTTGRARGALVRGNRSGWLRHRPTG